MDGWTRSIHNPQDPFEAVRTPILRLGGRIESSYFAVGSFDVLAITQFPDTMSIGEIPVAFATGGAVARILTTPLLTTERALEAMRKAGIVGYRSLLSDAAASAATAR
jgi:uncharacterized protein with GYD domain